MTEPTIRRFPLRRSSGASRACCVVFLLCGAVAAGGEQGDQRVDFPFVEVDRAARQIRVECETLNSEMPLEFFCVKFGGPEHEALLRTQAQPSHIHAGLLLLGLEPGAPTRFSEVADKWLPPHGPPLQVSIVFDRDGKRQVIPAHRLMRHIRTGKEMPPFTFIFAGSKVMEDGVYAADVAGYIVSIVNFELSLIDVPELASSANETLQWQFNPATVPPQGTKVTMLIAPAESRDDAPATAPTTSPATAPTTVPATPSRAQIPEPAGLQVELDQLRARWRNAVSPHAGALRAAAQTHYDVIQSLRQEQQRLIDEADRIQRLIDELEREYANLTTPQPTSR